MYVTLRQDLKCSLMTLCQNISFLTDLIELACWTDLGGAARHLREQATVSNQLGVWGV